MASSSSTERPERAPAAGEVALDVHAVGICGTDLHIWLGEYPSVPPVTMGHEVCGTVSAVGEGVDGELAGRARGGRDVLLHLRRVRVLPRRQAQRVRAAALDRHARRRRVRAAARAPGTEPPPRAGGAAGRGRRAVGAARVRVQLAARPERGAAGRRRAGGRAGRDRADRGAGRAGVRWAGDRARRAARPRPSLPGGRPRLRDLRGRRIPLRPPTSSSSARVRSAGSPTRWARRGGAAVSSRWACAAPT